MAISDEVIDSVLDVLGILIHQRPSSTQLLLFASDVNLCTSLHVTQLSATAGLWAAENIEGIYTTAYWRQI